MVGITAYGGYIPRYRLSRMTIIQNMAWYFPVIMAVATGEKAVANWDEDSVSMAVAAGLDCLAAKDRKSVDGVFFASTTMPFADRLNAGIISAALNVPESGVMCADFGSCLKAGTTAALAAVRAGKTGAELDQVARGMIEAAGYGPQFGHGLGHGVGLAIHEAPRLSRTWQQPLAAGQIVTVEPGIYLSGRMGVRIEDMAVVLPDGCRSFNRFDKSLLVLG